MDDKHFRTLIKQKRESMGLSLAVVGKKIGVSASAVQSWEKGKAKPKYAHAKALSAVLDIDIAEILNDPSHIAAPHAREVFL